ncbi:MAG: hypothetical protein WA823_09865 [Candidatus Acidiferrales bacterium]
MPSDPAQQAFADEEHLRLLALGYYVSAAITAVFSLLGLLYAGMGAVIGLAVSKGAAAAAETGQPTPQILGWLFGLIGFGLFAFMITMAALKFYTAVCLKQRKSRTFCLVVAAISCLEVPYGTILGVFTFLVLERPSVAGLFVAKQIPAPGPIQRAGITGSDPKV